MSSILNLRSPRSPMRYAFTSPRSLHLLSVLLWTLSTRQASLIVSMRRLPLPSSGSRFPFCAVSITAPPCLSFAPITPGSQWVLPPAEL